MAKVRETRLWQWLNRGSKYKLKGDMHMCRVENSTMNGMPDVEGCVFGRQFWIELKTIDRPRDPDRILKVRFEKEQVPWIERRGRAGGLAFVLLQVGSGKKALRYLIRGADTHIIEGGVNEEFLRTVSVTLPEASAEEILVKAASQ